MKTLQANNLQQALTVLKEVKDLDAKKIEAFFKKHAIRFADRKMYHLILVRRQNNPQKETYDVSFMVQQYNKRGYEKIKVGFGQFGYSQAIILHNPELLEETDAPTLTSFEKNRIDNSEEIRALKEKQKAEVDALKQQLADATAKNNVQTETVEETKTEETKAEKTEAVKEEKTETKTATKKK